MAPGYKYRSPTVQYLAPHHHAAWIKRELLFVFAAIGGLFACSVLLENAAVLHSGMHRRL
jgi:hypothetical protein